MALSTEQINAKQEMFQTLVNAWEDVTIFAEKILHFKPFDYNVPYLKSTSRRILYRAGRKVGKTQNTAAKALHFAWFAPWMNETVEDVCNILIVAPTMSQAEIMFGMVKQLAHRDPLFEAFIVKETSKDIWIRFITGKGHTRIMTRAAGETGVSLRGYVPHLIIVDEAAFIKREILTALFPSGIATRAQVWMCSTPFGQQGYFYEKCLDSRPGNESAKSLCSEDPDAPWEQFHANSMMNPVPDEEYFRELKMLTKDEYTQEVEGEFLSLGAALIPRDLIMKSLGDYEIHGYVNYAMGIDVAGRGKDETVISVIAYDERGNVYLRETQALPRSTMLDVADAVDHTWRKYGGLMDSIFMDITGLGQGALDNCLAKGIPVRGVDFLHQEKISMYMTVCRLFEHGKIRLGRENKMATQLGYLRTSATENNRLKIESEKEDDYPDSLALACKAVGGGEQWHALSMKGIFK